MSKCKRLHLHCVTFKLQLFSYQSELQPIQEDLNVLLRKFLNFDILLF